MSRRDFVRLSATAAAVAGVNLRGADLRALAAGATTVPNASTSGLSLYSDLLKTWCDGLLDHQLTNLPDSVINGGFLCPACALVHGRCADSVYPLLYMAHTTGDERYLRAGKLAFEWSERHVSRPDGSWVNDVLLNSWQGITVFRAIALAEALQHHGEILDPATRRAWTERLAKAAKFLDVFITMETGDINYPVTSTYCFVLCGEVLDSSHYAKRGRDIAHASAEYFTANHLLFGEGHPQTAVTPKGCRPIDLGYNVEESLPALALYSLVANDSEVRDKVIAALRAHMEFMLPDGSWDNSWGARNYKWTWWGSRTSDGCQPAYALLARHDPRFFEVANRNLRLMVECTHNGLLYGGPDYFVRGDPPCIHHTFTHAKALATVLDRRASIDPPRVSQKLPREEPYGLRSFPEIGTHLVAVGEWRATVTEYDFEYLESALGGGVVGQGGHASGGALSLLFHESLGTILVASMTEYQTIEAANQQSFRGSPHMTLTPRIECAGEESFTSLNDLNAEIDVSQTPDVVSFVVHGRLQTIQHKPISAGDVRYELGYALSKSRVTISVRVVNGRSLANAPSFVLPVVSRSNELIDLSDPQTLRVAKPGGFLTIHTETPGAFEHVPHERTFNLVPGFECIPLVFPMTHGAELKIEIAVGSGWHPRSRSLDVGRRRENR